MTGNHSSFCKAAKYLAVGRVTLRSQLAYLPELLWRTVFMMIIIFVFTQLWRTTYTAANASNLAGLTLPRMIWYLVVTESLILARPRQASLIDKEVKSGDLAYRLNKPYRYLLYHYSTFLAEAFIRVLVNLGVGSLVALALVGPIRVHPLAPVTLAAAATLGLTIEFLVNIAIGLGAFWVEDTSAFTWVYDKLLFILGGMMMPLDLFPALVRRISLILPMNFVAYRPARALVAFDPAALAPMFLGQLAWVAGLAVLAALIFRVGVKRVNVNGG